MSDATITLATAVGPNDELFIVSAAGTSHSAPIQFLIDSEECEAYEGTNGTAWRVRRGRNDTGRAGHAVNATLTIIGPTITDRGAFAVAVLGQADAQGDASYTLEAAFVANGAGTYTATFPVPAGATVRDVAVRNTVVWDSATSAALTVGDDDSATGYFSSTNVKTTPAADTNGAGQGLSTQGSLGASAGAYKGAAGKFCAAAKTITAVITSVGAGSAGRTRVLVEIARPKAATVVQT